MKEHFGIRRIEDPSSTCPEFDPDPHYVVTAQALPVALVGTKEAAEVVAKAFSEHKWTPLPLVTGTSLGQGGRRMDWK